MHCTAPLTIIIISRGSHHPAGLSRPGFPAVLAGLAVEAAMFAQAGQRQVPPAGVSLYVVPGGWGAPCTSWCTKHASSTGGSRPRSPRP